MKLYGKNVLLFIEPKFKNNKKIIIDDLSIKMFNEFKPVISQAYSPFEDFPSNWGSYGRQDGKVVFNAGKISLGHHECVCGAISSGCDYLLSNGMITNLLCVHYLTCHRNEISHSELEKVRSLNSSPILLGEDKEFFEKLIQINLKSNLEEK